jgi:hypothetical protein
LLRRAIDLHLSGLPDAAHPDAPMVIETIPSAYDKSSQGRRK